MLLVFHSKYFFYQIYQFKDQVRNELMKAIILYREDDDLQSLVDWVQKDWLHCCGIDGNHDWEKNIYFNCSSPGEEACGVPYSCCKVGLPNVYSFVVKLHHISLNVCRIAYCFNTACLRKVNSHPMLPWNLEQNLVQIL